ncbi:sensor histidine kinase [Oceanirhabdus sp. W0125-5]|uniref:sensor histidine kinase n=1 Tax=Oceanirhabdus sp. W0125-5 TaxID=2999116 RepID=UPI0022F32F3B|nr:sensor histidine kinase [Oceanirhabdus sp. W0125-5]WBW96531.1 sensor histidine kinase [Oceanirhabdus sp. W0125-5]
MNLIKNLVNNLGYIFLIAFIITRLRVFKRTIVKEKFKRSDILLLSMVFGCFGILGTYIGTEINGAIANTRMIGVVTGGILCGPFVGIVSGIIAGIHRLFMNVGSATALPCAIATIIAGIFSGYIYKIFNNKNKVLYGFICGIIMESIEMLMIFIMVNPKELAMAIIKHIYIPMAFTNAFGIALLIALVNSIVREKEEIAAKQSQIALEIANKTLPYFRDINEDTYEEICSIIKEYTDTDAVAITDKEKILAHVGAASDHHIKGEYFKTEATQNVLDTGEILELKNKKEINCSNKKCPLKSAIIAPLKDGDEIIGTLKIYYVKENKISHTNRSLVLGLSQLISTQLEISKLSILQDMANKAEIKALQAQINPHFLFNALNTIVSFVRMNPDKARELIINLSTYMRYNIENVMNLSDICKELEQVRAYVEIEKARFGDKLNVEYHIDDDVNIKIPSLIIQPIVENSIKHGIMKNGNSGTVSIEVKNISDDKVKVIVQDDGIGIPEEVIRRVYSGDVKQNKIGISNVHNRLKYFYGEGLNIERLDKGTRVSFIVKREEEL